MIWNFDSAGLVCDCFRSLVVDPDVFFTGQQLDVFRVHKQRFAPRSQFTQDADIAQLFEVYRCSLAFGNAGFDEIGDSAVWLFVNITPSTLHSTFLLVVNSGSKFAETAIGSISSVGGSSTDD